MHILYTFLFTLAVPFILLRLYWRSFKAPDYRRRWHERLGFYHASAPTSVLWFHAVSVGEVEAVAPLVHHFLDQPNQENILITTTTPTGSARVTALFKGRVEHVYLPYDLPNVVNRFIKHFKPQIGVIVETEIWPNLYAGCGKNNIPLAIINGRLSDSSVADYRKIRSLVNRTLSNVSVIATQSEQDSTRFKQIGASADQVQTVGNIKFDLTISVTILLEGELLKEVTFANRFVFLAASTHNGEEETLLKIYQRVKKQHPNLLLVLVPRHPERFQAVTALAQKYKLKTIMRSSGQLCDQRTDVYVADTMGELRMIYAGADIAFVGGSLVPHGGQNALEAAAVGVPIMFGPYMMNFKEITRGLLAVEGACQCSDETAVEQQLYRLINDAEKRQQMVKQAKQFVTKNQGALALITTIITGLLSSKGQR
ncbi:MAG: lipid IV(A) 3-deoxy-D-manno-octulosonic acid transferase [Methylococcales bacterium]|jgi:3-deoxy-D-manno-octulosonic-acid transferase|nr:lipid IV(A) 3-deoxy-D-manno-octulosonic acid transferase [Methylococcales bacterium]